MESTGLHRNKPTKNGYIRMRKKGERRFEHVFVWEKEFGKIPQGFFIHHIDGNKTNNDISNLQLVTKLEHKRIHSGCIKAGEEWMKPCKVCGEYKPCDEKHWYYQNGWIRGRMCKKCYIEYVNERKKA